MLIQFIMTAYCRPQDPAENEGERSRPTFKSTPTFMIPVPLMIPTGSKCKKHVCAEDHALLVLAVETSEVKA